jgi:hypothetical protein
MAVADADGTFRSTLPLEDRTPSVHHVERYESQTRICKACTCGAGVQIEVGDDERTLDAALAIHVPEEVTPRA